MQGPLIPASLGAPLLTLQLSCAGMPFFDIIIVFSVMSPKEVFDNLYSVKEVNLL